MGRRPVRWADVVDVGGELAVAVLADGVVVGDVASEDAPPFAVVDVAVAVGVPVVPLAGVVGAASTAGGYLWAAWFGAQADAH